MRVTHKIAATGVWATLLLTACAGGLSEGAKSARDACNGAFVFDQVVQGTKAGQTFIPERVQQGLSDMYKAAELAGQQDSQYQQLSLLVGRFRMALDSGDTSAVLDLVAIEGECQQLGHGMTP